MESLGGQQQPPQPPPPQQPPPPPQAPIQNYLVPAILVTVLCCLPGGIVAIIYAAQVNGKVQAGDIAGAQKAANNAKNWSLWSAVAGLVFGVLYILLMIGIGASGM